MLITSFLFNNPLLIVFQELWMGRRHRKAAVSPHRHLICMELDLFSLRFTLLFFSFVVCKLSRVSLLKGAATNSQCFNGLKDYQTFYQPLLGKLLFLEHSLNSIRCNSSSFDGEAEHFFLQTFLTKWMWLLINYIIILSGRCSHINSDLSDVELFRLSGTFIYLFFFWYISLILKIRQLVCAHSQAAAQSGCVWWWWGGAASGKISWREFRVRASGAKWGLYKWKQMPGIMNLSGRRWGWRWWSTSLPGWLSLTAYFYLSVATGLPVGLEQGPVGKVKHAK